MMMEKARSTVVYLDALLGPPMTRSREQGNFRDSLPVPKKDWQLGKIGSKPPVPGSVSKSWLVPRGI